MGRYMTVVLNEPFKNETFIQELNIELALRYGAINKNLFVSWKYLEEEADYINNTPDGQKQLPHFPRPITKEALNENFFWYRYGQYTCKLSGGGTTVQEAIDAIAVCNWIRKTKGKHINKVYSNNYSKAIVGEYLNYLFVDAGINLEKIWQLPK